MCSMCRVCPVSSREGEVPGASRGVDGGAGEDRDGRAIRPGRRPGRRPENIKTRKQYKNKINSLKKKRG